MEILFGIVILALLIWGLINRKQHRREWIKEERYEESGAWLDKRSGERGTYGSLDEEMESSRKWISMQGKANELAKNLQTTIAAQLPEYQSLEPDQQKRYFDWLKSEILNLFKRLEDLKTGKSSPNNTLESALHPLATPLKKQVLDYCYTQFPDLLRLDIEVLKDWDQTCQQWCDRILSKLPG
jgi:hypothetical protein